MEKKKELQKYKYKYTCLHFVGYGLQGREKGRQDHRPVNEHRYLVKCAADKRYKVVSTA